METVLKTVGLSKKYGSRYVVRGVNMTINKGDIYGFIGKNGAGKTTFMRVILGLSEPTEGSFELFGGISREEAGRKTGALIEAPGIYPNCTAKENMKRFALLKGADANSIDGILEFVGLGDVGNKKAGKFSLGMKQRLGIAVALLGDPEFLVLDEPVNGLDPAGMKEVRDLIVKLNKERGVTVLISSHLLDELSKIVTRYGIINNGVLVDRTRRSRNKGSRRMQTAHSCGRRRKGRGTARKNAVGEAAITVNGHAIEISVGAERSAGTEQTARTKRSGCQRTLRYDGRA